MARGGLTALVLEGGAREAGGPGPPRVLPRRDVVNKTQLHPVGSFAERHPANSPHGDFSQQIPKATKTPATRFCPEKGGVLRTSCSQMTNYNQERQSYRLRWLGADLPPSVLEGGTREAGGPGPPRVLPRRDVVNKTQLHPVGSFAERHPANSPLGDFSQTFTATFPQPTETSNNSILSGKRGCFPDK